MTGEEEYTAALADCGISQDGSGFNIRRDGPPLIARIDAGELTWEEAEAQGIMPSGRSEATLREILSEMMSKS